MRVSGSEAVVTCRRISLKSYLEELGLTARPVRGSRSFPHALLAGLLHGSGSAGERPAEVPPPPSLPASHKNNPGTASTQRISQKTLSRRFPGRPWTPNSDHRPASSRGSQTRLRSKAAQER